MKLSLLILFLATTASAADFAQFTRAVHLVSCLHVCAFRLTVST